ncbi:DUF29 domain-containing protein [Endozoicomonas sp. ALD040]|uniref:DUF29 domain-containing protein n=1 Tax=unclassified Endozoicomonas TaxID=2644528 RepID=UPI003BB1DAE5
MKNLYETDYYRWVEQQKEYLTNRQFDQLDIDNLIGEIDDMSSELDTLESRLTTLLLHLLKYDYQIRVLNPVLPEPYNCRDWKGTINRTRLAINKLIKRRPHLQSEVKSLFDEAYVDGKVLAIKAMNDYVQPHQQLNEHSFPEICPWTFDQIMEEDWLPFDAVIPDEKKM